MRLCEVSGALLIHTRNRLGVAVSVSKLRNHGLLCNFTSSQHLAFGNLVQNLATFVQNYLARYDSKELRYTALAADLIEAHLHDALQL